MTQLIFKENSELTIGVELELQLVNLQTFNLAMESEDFLRRLSMFFTPDQIKPEIAQSMIEINSSIHKTYNSLIAELKEFRNIISSEAERSHIGVCGGGSHPFQKWNEQRIFQKDRFESVSEQYGFLAKQFTVFGQHIHIACQNGDDALYLCHAMARYIPHFIALAASSPFNQGVDTAFDCSRLTVVSAFPLSGTPPWILRWDELVEYYDKLIRLGVITTMKDFYWDIRPKPEYGTVELRICDTPLTVNRAAELAALAQLLAHWLLETRPVISQDTYLTYLTNRFRASRYGLNAIIIDPIEQKSIRLADDIVNICHNLKLYEKEFSCEEALINISNIATTRKNDAAWLRKYYNNSDSLNDTVREQVSVWRQSDAELLKPREGHLDNSIKKDTLNTKIINSKRKLQAN